MILKVGCKIRIGEWEADTSQDPHTELVSVETLAQTGSPVARCRIALYVAPPKAKGLLDAALGAAAGALGGAAGGIAGGLGDALGLGGGAPAGPSATVRGKTLQIGDPLRLELTSGDTSGLAMTARLSGIETRIGTTGDADGGGTLILTGENALQRLARARLNQVYQSQSVEQMVRDIVGQVGSTEQTDVGTINVDSDARPYFVITETRSVLDHLLQLARQEGAEIFADTENKLVMQTPEAVSPDQADHTLYYGRDLLTVSVIRAAPRAGTVRVRAESPGGSKGRDAWAWLAKDGATVTAESGSATPILPFSDAALRSKDAAQRLADGVYGSLTAQATQLRIRIMGDPTLYLGQSVALAAAPYPEMNAAFRIAAVQHRYDRTHGFTTTLRLTAPPAKGISGGGLLSDVAGALGL